MEERAMGGFSLASWTLLEPSRTIQVYKRDVPCMGVAVHVETLIEKHL